MQFQSILCMHTLKKKKMKNQKLKTVQKFTVGNGKYFFP